MQPVPLDVYDPMLLMDGDAQPAQAGKRRLRIGRGGIIADLRGAVCQGREQGRPVRNGLIRGQENGAVEPGGFPDGLMHSHGVRGRCARGGEASSAAPAVSSCVPAPSTGEGQGEGEKNPPPRS